MKNIIYILLFCSITIASSESSLAKSPKKSSGFDNSLTVDPFGLSYGALNLKYENQLSPENSFTIGGYLYNENDWSGYGLSASYRWYLLTSKASPIKGLSTGPLIILSSWNWDGGNNKHYSGGSDIGIGGELNYKWIIGDWFTVEPNLQVFLPIRKADGHTYRGWGFGISLGYSW